jgi:molybdate transport system substrate-binding protein
MRVLSTLALKGLLEKFKPPLEQKLGAQLELHFDATQSILAKLQRGEQADLLILTVEAMQALDVKHVCKLGSSGVGIAVRAGAPKPDISTVDALKRALLSARSLASSRKARSGSPSPRARRKSACSSFASSRRWRESRSSARFPLSSRS